MIQRRSPHRHEAEAAQGKALPGGSEQFIGVVAVREQVIPPTRTQPAPVSAPEAATVATGIDRGLVFKIYLVNGGAPPGGRDTTGGLIRGFGVAVMAGAATP